jgi:hypothetical protein
MNKKFFEDLLIQAFLDDLHNQQLDMIDEAVVMSDGHEAKEVLKYIMEK